MNHTVEVKWHQLGAMEDYIDPWYTKGHVFTIEIENTEFGRWFDENNIPFNYAYMICDKMFDSTLSTGVIFVFDNATDAMQFKLTWC